MLSLLRNFFTDLSNHSGTTLHVNVPHGTNRHHIIEAIFKAVARALDIATSFDNRISGIPSTKGDALIELLSEL